jgi:hypothetical protein
MLKSLPEGIGTGSQSLIQRSFQSVFDDGVEKMKFRILPLPFPDGIMERVQEDSDESVFQDFMVGLNRLYVRSDIPGDFFLRKVVFPFLLARTKRSCAEAVLVSCYSIIVRRLWSIIK